MVTEAQDIRRAHRITGARGAAVRTAVYPAVLAPRPAYGTRLRGIGFADDNGTSRLVLQLLDELTGAGRAHLLGLHPSDALGRLIERLADEARGTRERLSYCMGGLVRGIPHLALGLVENVILAALQPFPAPRILGLARLRLLEARQGLVAPLDDRFDAAPAHQEHPHAIRGGKQRVYPQVHANNGLLSARRVLTCQDTTHGPQR